MHQCFARGCSSPSLSNLFDLILILCPLRSLQDSFLTLTLAIARAGSGTKGEIFIQLQAYHRTWTRVSGEGLFNLEECYTNSFRCLRFASCGVICFHKKLQSCHGTLLSPLPVITRYHTSHVYRAELPGKSREDWADPLERSLRCQGHNDNF